MGRTETVRLSANFLRAQELCARMPNQGRPSSHTPIHPPLCSQRNVFWKNVHRKNVYWKSRGAVLMMLISSLALGHLRPISSFHSPGLRRTAELWRILRAVGFCSTWPEPGMRWRHRWGAWWARTWSGSPERCPRPATNRCGWSANGVIFTLMSAFLIVNPYEKFRFDSISHILALSLYLLSYVLVGKHRLT